MSFPVISIQGIGKCYKLGATHGRPAYKALRESITSVFKTPINLSSNKQSGNEGNGDVQYIWALKDISFDVHQGEVIGIIGRNGAGKSTLLKILSQITEPTEGEIRIQGRIASLLEVGTGFHPELTGRENIFMNGAILGMTRAEIKKKFDEIVTFADVEKFIDTPVKRYSSGMYVRLAFAVAAHLEPEILLVDEVLAVGDAAFQKKCLGKMEDVTKQGRTIIFVSHNMAAIENLCDRCILLDAGRLSCEGKTLLVIRRYLQEVLPAITSIPLHERKDRSGNGKVRFRSFHLEDNQGNKLTALQSGKDANFLFSYSCENDVSPKDVSVGFGIFSNDGQLLFVLYNSYTGQTFESIPSSGQFRCHVPHLPLSSGKYHLNARITVGGEEADWPRDAIALLDVEPGDFFGTGSLGFEGRCPFLVTGSWAVNEEKNSEFCRKNNF